LSGSVFFDITAKSPWAAETPPAAQIANDVTPGAQHVLEYHVVTRGTCWISLVGDAAIEPVADGPRLRVRPLSARRTHRAVLLPVARRPMRR
jgi:Cupin